MRASITNFGPSRSFPTCLGNVFLAKGDTQILDSAKAIAEISAFPYLKITPIQGAPNPKPAPAAANPNIQPPVIPAQGGERKRIDWPALRIAELRAIAARHGVAGFFTMRKTVLIERLTAILG